MRILLRCAVALTVFFAFSVHVFPAEKPIVLPKEHILKLKRIAAIVSDAITKRSIKTVAVENFTDYKGNPSSRGAAMSNEFRKQLEKAGKGSFVIVSENAEATVKGVLLPFKSGNKWRLDIKTVAGEKDNVIDSYTGIFKKPVKTKK